jgi:hypothetical protein
MSGHCGGRGETALLANRGGRRAPCREAISDPVGLVPDGSSRGSSGADCFCSWRPLRIETQPRHSPGMQRTRNWRQVTSKARLLLERMQSAPWRTFRWIIESEQARLVIGLVCPASGWRVPHFEGRVSVEKDQDVEEGGRGQSRMGRGRSARTTRADYSIGLLSRVGQQS